jgi:DNA-binding MarR family transcriptional regulator
MTGTAGKRKTDAPLQSKDRLRLWLRLLACTTTIEQVIRAKLRAEFDTTLPRFDVLAMLARSDKGVTMSELSRSLMVSNGNVTGLVDRMADEGLVMRIPHPGDRRSSYVALSNKGRERFDEMAACHSGWIDDMFEGLGAEDAEDLTRILHVLRDSAIGEKTR